MRYWLVGSALILMCPAVPAAAQWVNVPTPQFADPYAPLRQLEASQATQAAQEQAQAAQLQAQALQQQTYLQQQQLELQRRQLQLQMERQKQQIELQRQQLALQQQALQEADAAQRKVAQASARVVPEGVYLNSETRLDDGTKRCSFTNGLKRVIPSTADCWTR